MLSKCIAIILDRVIRYGLFFFIKRLEIIKPRGKRYLLRFCCTFGKKTFTRKFFSDQFFTDFFFVRLVLKMVFYINFVPIFRHKCFKMLSKKLNEKLPKKQHKSYSSRIPMKLESVEQLIYQTLLLRLSKSDFPQFRESTNQEFCTESHEFAK